MHKDCHNNPSKILPSETKIKEIQRKGKQAGVFTSCYTTFKILIGKLGGLFPVEDQFSGFCDTFDNC